ncbi:unnamed protein product [Notodromas monacha]|uniref:Uncharacterized protein n=1 Tax=Notodromas monacha TaxID=399045 RepID=A0A7R9GFA8_9CRUS|nr:unnamed protein product [Notodromas monacha]CAG0918640.1 unnamed protein product [Notodromas monacha]
MDVNTLGFVNPRYSSDTFADDVTTSRSSKLNRSMKTIFDHCLPWRRKRDKDDMNEGRHGWYNTSYEYPRSRIPEPYHSTEETARMMVHLNHAHIHAMRELNWKYHESKAFRSSMSNPAMNWQLKPKRPSVQNTPLKLTRDQDEPMKRTSSLDSTFVNSGQYHQFHTLKIASCDVWSTSTFKRCSPPALTKRNTEFNRNVPPSRKGVIEGRGEGSSTSELPWYSNWNPKDTLRVLWSAPKFKESSEDGARDQKSKLF